MVVPDVVEKTLLDFEREPPFTHFHAILVDQYNLHSLDANCELDKNDLPEVYFLPLLMFCSLKFYIFAFQLELSKPENAQRFRK